MRLLPSRIPGIRVYTPHAFRSMDPTLNPFSRTAIAIAEYILALRCDKIVVLCQKEFETARQLAIPESKLVIIQNGCDTPELPSRSNARRELGLNEEDIVLGFVGRFTHQKAPERLIDALKYIENPNVKCVLVGDGDLEETLKRQVCALGLSNRVLFAGSRSGQLAMPAFDILVIPSRYESAPYVLLEAFHAGIPVVSTPTGNAEDLIEDGFNGRIASESNDAKSWGSLLTKMLLPETLVKLRKHAQERRQVVTVEDMVSNTMGLYKNTIYEIGNRRRRRSKFL
ncbi:D-inositol 3-phosphate glycosyltransferase [Thiorhodovibrio litoralis]|nr:D-inositol 3-phosphate glycosyltransferase [Thiorhodovibrio litoralis]